jgi:Zn-dependent M16 (insulinase) family peptidase
MGFQLENSRSIKFPNFNSNINTYVWDDSTFRVVFASVPGPIVSSSVVVPTLALENNGLPHTLEHLVFCGSKSKPFRGYLDNLATRCLSTGTNAYTAEDHTCFEITTAGN